jgi:hypothetical protein
VRGEMLGKRWRKPGVFDRDVTGLFLEGISSGLPCLFLEKRLV